MATATPPPGSDDDRRGPVRLAAVIGGGSLVGGATIVLAAALLLSAVAWEGCSLPELGPGKGTRSQRLPVTVAPRTGLTDGQTVIVTSPSFTAGSVVGVAVCLQEADVRAVGVDACDTTSAERFATDPSGTLAVAFTVPRVVTVGGSAYDCAEKAERCLVVAASSSDYDISGGQPVTFAPGLGPADLTPAGPRPTSLLLPGTVTPTGPVAAGSPVTVTASGFVPGEPVLVSTCTSAFPHRNAWEVCAKDRAGAGLDALWGGDVSGVPDRADATGSYTTTVTVPRRIELVLSTSEPTAAATSCTGAQRCGVVIAAAADFSRSAYLPLVVE